MNNNIIHNDQRLLTPNLKTMIKGLLGINNEVKSEEKDIKDDETIKQVTLSVNDNLGNHAKKSRAGYMKKYGESKKREVKELKELNNLMTLSICELVNLFSPIIDNELINDITNEKNIFDKMKKIIDVFNLIVQYLHNNFQQLIHQ